MRNRDRVIGIGDPVLARYERIAFEKDLIAPQGEPLAAFVCPGHPLLDATLDLTLVRRGDGGELDMGSPFDFFSPKSWPSDASVSGEAHANRALLAGAMTHGGFRPYKKEWWHFTLAGEPFPDTYFDFPIR